MLTPYLTATHFGQIRRRRRICLGSSPQHRRPPSSKPPTNLEGLQAMPEGAFPKPNSCTHSAPLIGRACPCQGLQSYARRKPGMAALGFTLLPMDRLLPTRKDSKALICAHGGTSLPRGTHHVQALRHESLT